MWSNEPQKFRLSLLLLKRQQLRTMQGDLANLPPRALQEKEAAPKNLQGFCPDKVDFIYKRDTPLVCSNKDCARFVRQVRGSSDRLPFVKDRVFQDN